MEKQMIDGTVAPSATGVNYADILVVVQFQRKPKIAHKIDAVKTMANSTAPVILMSFSLLGVGFFTLKIRHNSSG